MNLKTLLFAIAAIGLFSFAPGGDTIEISYPKNSEAVILMTAGKFKPFQQEWRGTDYYYSAQSDHGILCSVLFYKLEDGEVKSLVTDVAHMINGPEASPAYPLTYFATYSNTKEFETNDQKWGDPAADFMFRQMDIKEFKGEMVNQKNMFAYAMFGNNLFVNIHLSKVNCTPADSVEMRQILEALKKKK